MAANNRPVDLSLAPVRVMREFLRRRQMEDSGVTGMSIWAESHAAIHTWDEDNYYAFDAFSCKDFRPKDALRLLLSHFDTEMLNCVNLLRFQRSLSAGDQLPGQRELGRARQGRCGGRARLGELRRDLSRIRGSAGGSLAAWLRELRRGQHGLDQIPLVAGPRDLVLVAQLPARRSQRWKLPAATAVTPRRGHAHVAGPLGAVVGVERAGARRRRLARSRRGSTGGPELDQPTRAAARLRGSAAGNAAPR